MYDKVTLLPCSDTSLMCEVLREGGLVLYHVVFAAVEGPVHLGLLPLRHAQDSVADVVAVSLTQAGASSGQPPLFPSLFPLEPCRIYTGPM